MSSWLFGVGFSRAALAQDAPSEPSPPSDLPTPPAAPTSPVTPPAAPPVDAPPPRVDATPPVTAPPATPPVAAPPADAPPAPPAAASAAFAPLPEAPRAPAPKAATKANGAPSDGAAPAEERTQPAAPAEVHHQEDSDKSDDDSNGILGPFRIGALIGGGLPEVLTFGGQLKLTRYFGAGINIGLIPTVKLSLYGDAKISYQEYDAYGRLYPFGGSFFLGAGVGYATIKGTVNSQFSTTTVQNMYPDFEAEIPNPLLVDSQAQVRTLVLTPQIGFMKIFGSGFAIGLDVGAQLPIAPSKVDFTTNTPNISNATLRDTLQTTYIKPNDDKVRSTLNTIGRTPLPTFNLKIGWFL